VKQDERLSPVAMLLVCLCSWSLPLLTDPMLPALPVLREAFAVPMPRVQLVFSLALAAFAVAQAFMGLWADRYGRRPVLLVGFGLYVVGAALAGQASSFDELLLWRVVQSAGAAAGPVLARAIVRDVLPPSKAARAFSLLGLGMAVVPLFAPALSSKLLALYGWPGPFYFFLAYGVVVWCLVALLYRETLPAKDLAALQPARLVAALREILSARERVAALATIGCGYSVIVVYMSTAPVVFQQWFGIAPAQLGLWITLSLIGFPVGCLLSLWLVKGLSGRVLQRGAAVFALGGLLQWVLCVVWPVPSPYAFVLPMAVLTLGWGMVQPQLQAVTLAIAPALVGRGSALLGVIQLGTGGLVAWVVSHYVDGTPTLTATLLAVGGLCSLGCAAATAALSRRGAVLGR
jgi:DHA1 family bicyclomycin/chloramphenicol resistance-like MFS transporter